MVFDDEVLSDMRHRSPAWQAYIYGLSGAGCENASISTTRSRGYPTAATPEFRL
jgi:hypothetical protein